jgi:hypothetical protein
LDCSIQCARIQGDHAPFSHRLSSEIQPVPCAKAVLRQRHVSPTRGPPGPQGGRPDKDSCGVSGSLRAAGSPTVSGRAPSGPSVGAPLLARSSGQPQSRRLAGLPLLTHSGSTADTASTTPEATAHSPPAAITSAATCMTTGRHPAPSDITALQVRAAAHGRRAAGADTFPACVACCLVPAQRAPADDFGCLSSERAVLGERKREWGS